MRLVCCKQSEEEIANNKRSKNIDAMIHKERYSTYFNVKLLLLGTRHSGKSIFLKQMKLLQKDGFSNTEIMKFAKVLQENCLHSMQSILQCEDVKISMKSKEVKDMVLNIGSEAKDLAKCSNEIKLLWQEKAIKDAFNNRTVLGITIPSNSDYFFEHVERFAQENFLPTPEDMFRAKLKTTGIKEIVFELNKTQFTLVDMGGSFSSKIIHCFDDVTSIIFLAALDQYDMTLEEDLSTNRLEASLRLFSEVTSLFRPFSWILFLTKSDLFEIKIKKAPLSNFFQDIPENKGSDYEAGCQYIQKLYQANFRGLRLYPYVTCAIDTENCKRVVYVVRETDNCVALSEAGF